MSAAVDLQIAVDGICQEINHNARARASSGLNIIRNATLIVLGQDGTGRRYGSHVASAPGMAPAPMSSDLRKNWQRTQLVTPNGMGKWGLRITLKSKSDMPYQKFLEFGTKKMEKRPHVQRIKDKAKPQLLALFSSI